MNVKYKTESRFGIDVNFLVINFDGNCCPLGEPVRCKIGEDELCSILLK